MNDAFKSYPDRNQRGFMARIFGCTFFFCKSAKKLFVS